MSEENTKHKSERALREEAVLAFWNENGIFEKTLSKDAPKGEFVFYDGPPTANGMPGLHHVEPQSFKDVIPRYKTMQGYRVPRRAGWDTHGLPVELQVEKELGLKSKKEIESYGIAAFNQKCKESVWKYKEEWMKMRQRMAFWTDLDHAYITYKNGYIEALWSVIAKADGRGHLYKDFKVVPWCTRCGTALSSHELNQPGAYQDIKDLSVYVKFKVKGEENTYLLAWTTTPWTLPGNVALAVGKDIEYVKVKVDDEFFILAKERLSVLEGSPEIISEMKGSDLLGWEYEPLYPYLSALDAGDEKLANAFKVYAADFVTTEDGTGIVHTAVMYGQDDFELGTKVGLPKYHLVDEEGKFVRGTDFLEGRYVRETDANGKPTLAVDVINDLTTRGLLLKKENHLHSYPHCWRCGTPLIYYARTSWYFRMSALRDQLLAANETINWEPKHIKEGRFGEWLDGIKDWAISRDRYWGTPLPIWENAAGEKLVVDSIDTLKQYGKKSGNRYFVMRHGESMHNTKNLWSTTPGTPGDSLTETGKAQAVASAKKLGEPIDVIIASPFRRGQETAIAAAEALGIPAESIITDPRIGEWNVGAEFDGQDMESYFAVRNKSADRYHFKTNDGESYADVFARTGSFIYEVESKYQGKNILIVTHGGSARAIEFVAHGFAYDTLFETTRDYRNFDNAEIREAVFAPLPHNSEYELDLHKPYIDEVVLEKDGERFTRTKEVMDVWFDSGAMPYAQGHEPGMPVDFNPAPADYISEAIDQTRGWFYTLHAVSNLISDEPRAAFKNVICLGHILDANGQKMSKSKGNVVDPWDMFAKYGADTIRLWMCSVNQPGDSKNFDEKTVKELENKVFNLLGNVMSFYELYRDQALETAAISPSAHALDAWITARLNQLIALTTDSLDAYDLFKPARAIRDFVDDLSTWYLRRSRDRLKDGDADAKRTLYTVLKTLAKVLAPFAPFTAEDLWQKLKTANDEESVHLAAWPEAGTYEMDILGGMDMVRDLSNQGNMLRKKSSIPIRQPLSTFFIPATISEQYQELLKDELNVKKIEKSDKGDISYFDTNITPELKLEGEYRELIRAAQDLRKEKGLTPGDIIMLRLPEQYREIAGKYDEDLKKTVGAHTVLIEGEEITID